MNDNITIADQLEDLFKDAEENGWFTSGHADEGLPILPGGIHLEDTSPNFTIQEPALLLTDDMKIKVEDEVVMTGLELKICLKYLKKLAMEEIPEDFV